MPGKILSYLTPKRARILPTIIADRKTRHLINESRRRFRHASYQENVVGLDVGWRVGRNGNRSASHTDHAKYHRGEHKRAKHKLRHNQARRGLWKNT